MRKIAVAALLLVVCAAPAFALHKRPHKDPRFAEHPKAFHEKNQHQKERVKHKAQKHHA
ncbi:MAG TPA: hypothetical protein VGI45_16215 [Terracidiphilus sp.]|jgi:hypothetical protein